MPASAIRAELDRIVRSRVFVHSHRIHRFLQFVVEECLLEQQHRLKEYLIGLEVFNRKADAGFVAVLQKWRAALRPQKG